MRLPGMRLADLPPRVVAIAVPVLATATAMAIGLGLVLATGAGLHETLTTLWNGIAGSPFASGTTSSRIVVLALVGTGYVIAARAGLVNVGGEGQISIGGLAAAAVALKLASGLPGPLAVAVPLLAAALGGALWGVLAGLLRALRGTNEVISTLLLNFVGIGLVSLAVHETGILRRPRTSLETLPTTLPMPESTRVPLLGLGLGSPANAGLIIAAAVLVVAWVALRHGSLGMRLKAVGLSAGTALRAGMSTGCTQVLALGLSGACGGLAGGLLVVATPFVLQEGFSANYGFDGLVVGLLARNSILGVLAGAVLFGAMRSGGVALEVGVDVPAQTVLVVQALLAIALAGSVRLLGSGARGSAAA